MASDRVVEEREGQALANKHFLPFAEISAKTGENVDEVFKTVGNLLVEEYLPKRSVEKIRYSLSSTSHMINTK